MAPAQRGRSMKSFRFSLKARNPRGASSRAIRRMRRNGTSGNQHHAGQADRGSPPVSARQRARFSARLAVDAIGNPFQIGVFGRKIGDHPQRQFREEWRACARSGGRFSSSVPLANATLIFGFKSDQQVAVRLRAAVPER